MYNLLMIDPPWPVKKITRKVRPNQTPDLDYTTLTIPEIFELMDKDILSQALEQHTVFLWCVERCLAQAEAQMAQRGYRLHTRIIWDKKNGVAPNMTVRYSHEYLLWYYKPKMMPIAQSMRGKLTTVWQEAGREHSRKPEIAYQNIQALYPEATRLDAFSRQARPGWAQYGDQPSYFTTQLELVSTLEIRAASKVLEGGAQALIFDSL